MAEFDIPEGLVPVGLDGFVVEVGKQGQRFPLKTAAERLPFEEATQVRNFPAWVSMRHYPGLRWCATVDWLVGYESWEERDVLTELDYDRDYVAFASQPLGLWWPDERGKSRGHVLDYFARRADGTGVLIDVRATGRRDDDFKYKAEHTQAACDLVGWDYQIRERPADPWLRNLKWLHAFSRPLDPEFDDLIVRAIDMFEQPRPLMDGIRRLGSQPWVGAVVFHLLWYQFLHTDLITALLDEDSEIVRR